MTSNTMDKCSEVSSEVMGPLKIGIKRYGRGRVCLGFFLRQIGEGKPWKEIQQWQAELIAERHGLLTAFSTRIKQLRKVVR